MVEIDCRVSSNLHSSQRLSSSMPPILFQMHIKLRNHTCKVIYEASNGQDPDNLPLFLLTEPDVIKKKVLGHLHGFPAESLWLLVVGGWWLKLAATPLIHNLLYLPSIRSHQSYLWIANESRCYLHELATSTRCDLFG